MGRRKVDKKPLRRERLIQLMEETGVSQSELSRLTGIAQQNISKMVRENDYQNLTEESAYSIIQAFPGYRLSWLLGFDDYKTEADMNFEFALEGIREAAYVYGAIALIAKTMDYDIELIPSKNGNGMVAPNDALTVMHERCDISSNGVTVSISPERWDEIANDVCDFLELKLTRILKADPAQ